MPSTFKVEDDQYVQLFDLSSSQTLLNSTKPRAIGSPTTDDSETFKNAFRLNVMVPYEPFGNEGLKWDEMPWNEQAVQKFAKEFIQYACAIAAELEKGKDVLVFCTNGRSRSPCVLAGFFVLFRGYPLHEIIAWFQEAFPAQRPKTSETSINGLFPNFNRFLNVLNFLVEKRDFVNDVVKTCQQILEIDLLSKLFPSPKADAYMVDNMPPYCLELPLSSFPAWAGKSVKEWAGRKKQEQSQTRPITRHQNKTTAPLPAVRSPDLASKVKMEMALDSTTKPRSLARTVSPHDEQKLEASIDRTTSTPNEEDPRLVQKGTQKKRKAPPQQPKEGSRHSQRGKHPRDLFEPGSENGKGLQQDDLTTIHEKEAQGRWWWITYLTDEGWRRVNGISTNHCFIPAIFNGIPAKMIKKHGKDGIHYADGDESLYNMMHKCRTIKMTTEKFADLGDYFDVRELEDLNEELDHLRKEEQPTPAIGPSDEPVIENHPFVAGDTQPEAEQYEARGHVSREEPDLSTVDKMQAIYNVYESLSAAHQELLDESLSTWMTLPHIANAAGGDLLASSHRSFVVEMQKVKRIYQSLSPGARKVLLEDMKTWGVEEP